jgi:hypothetical protein
VVFADEVRTRVHRDGQSPSRNLGIAVRRAGAITGTPAITGTFPLTLSATDSRGIATTVDLTIVVYSRLAIATTRLVNPWVGRPYRATVRTSGAVRPVRFGVRSGRLPTGIRLNKNTGVLSGKPRSPGTYRVTIEAHDGLRRTAKQMYVLSVRAIATA